MEDEQAAVLSQMLQQARAAVAAGEPHVALKLVVRAMQLSGEQAAVGPALGRVLQQLAGGPGGQAPQHQEALLQDLSQLFAAVAIGNGAPMQQPAGASAPQHQHPHAAGMPLLSPPLPARHVQPEPGSCCQPPVAPAASAAAGCAAYSSGVDRAPMETGSSGGGGGGNGDGTGACDMSLSLSGQAGRSGGGGGMGGDDDDVEATSALQAGALSGQPILCETGREGITQCALDDGSSYECPQCRGIVKRDRRAQHDRFWCQPP